MIPERPTFKGDGESHNMMDILPERLTLRVPPLNTIIFPWKFKVINELFCPIDVSRGRRTIFREVTVNPYKIRPEASRLINRPRRNFSSFEVLFDIFKRAIEKVWDPDKLHLVGHSSGVDSRLMSKAISELTKKNGKEWAGEVLYVENMGEWKLFNQIKDVMGFKGRAMEQSPRILNDTYIDFRTQWEKHNGVVAYPLNQWYDGYKHMNLPSKNVQGFTGYGANETQTKAMYNHWGYRWYFRWVYHLQLSLFKHWGGDWEHPFLDWNFLHALKYSDARKLVRINVEMSEMFTPELNHIPHVHTKEVTSMGYRTLPDSVIQRCYREYERSWFGKHFPVNPDPRIIYSKWWYYYNAASWCEQILERGHKITIG